MGGRDENRGLQGTECERQRTLRYINSCEGRQRIAATIELRATLSTVSAQSPRVSLALLLTIRTSSNASAQVTPSDLPAV